MDNKYLWIDDINKTHSSSFLMPSQSLIWLCLVPCWVSHLLNMEKTQCEKHGIKKEALDINQYMCCKGRMCFFVCFVFLVIVIVLIDSVVKYCDIWSGTINSFSQDYLKSCLCSSDIQRDLKESFLRPPAQNLLHESLELTAGIDLGSSLAGWDQASCC